MERHNSLSRTDIKGAAVRYGLAIAAAVVAVWLRSLLTPLLGLKNPYHTVWAAVVFAAWYCGLGASVAATIVGLVGVWYWLLPPVGTWAVPASADRYGMVGFVLFAGLIVALGEANRRSRREGQRAQARFNAFMENSPATAYLKDEEGKYVYANRASRARFQQASVIGKTDFDLFPAELAAQCREHDLLVLAENSAREFIEHSVQEDGKHAWLTVKFPVPNPDGKRLLGGKAFDITDRYRAEEAVRKAREELELRVKERTAELSKANEGLRDLSARLLQVQDEERRRIARELHDSVGQLLAAVKMNISAVQATALDPVAAKAAAENLSLIDQISDDIRTVSYLLHPPLLDEVGLPSALEWYIQGFSERSKIPVSLDIDGDFGRLDKDMEIAIFRMVQECLTNVHRHSNSPRAGVRLAQKQGQIVVEIADAGRGIPPEKQDGLKASGQMGVGFRGMRERIAQLGGVLEIHSNGKGTVVAATVPFEVTAGKEIA
jgi:PAS domain S-box-containing protein